MTNNEIALKVFISTKIVDAMFAYNELFWKVLINGEKDRFLAALQKCLESLEIPNPFPSTDQELSDLIFSWTIPIRSAILFEFLPKNEEGQAIMNNDTLCGRK